MGSQDDALTTDERIRTSILQGESHFREFKSALEGPPADKQPRDPASIRRDIGEALVSFANADGGELLVGVEDHGQISGIPHGSRTVETFLQAPVTNVLEATPLSGVVRARVRTEGMLLLFFAIDKSTAHVHQTSDGRCMQRRDRETRPISSETLMLERAEQLSREYDRGFVEGATVADLDERLVAKLVGALGGTLSPEKALQLVELAEYAAGRVRLRRAALLLFASDIQRWHPRSQVRIFRVHGTEVRAGGPDYNVEDVETATGAVVGLVAEAWDAMRPHLSRTVYSSGVFESRVSYPDDACFEALLNAIAHRDYANEGRPVEIFLFDDRLEIRSPGGLLSNVSLEGLTSLEGVHQSRNAFVARGLRELGLMREMGEGMRRIFQLFRQNDLIDPILSSDSDVFAIAFLHRSVFSQAAQRWLAAFDRFHLSREERQVILMGQDGTLFSPQDVLQTLGIGDGEEYRRLIESLQLKGLLESTMSKSQIANAMRNKRVRGGIGQARRQVARYRIRDPLEADVFFSELSRAVRAKLASQADPLSAGNLEELRRSLSSDSPYRKGQFVRVLQALDLLDESRRPKM